MVLKGVASLRERFRQEGLELELQPGGEVHLAPELVERVQDGRAPTLADNGKTLLLELSLSQYPVELETLIFELKLAELEIVLAHPERIRYFQEHPDRYETAVRGGAWGQITTGSILGLFGSRVREYSEELLRKGLVHVLASDAHNTRRRSPLLSPALEALVPLVGEDYAQSMVETTPRALLEGRAPVLPPLEREPPRRTTFLSRILGRSRGRE